ncbi:MAG: DNA polymerase III subunit beta [Fusobacteriia bacterium 4572_132]|nr:MAG: DNA polymerase III subunit beta [Fusobacteriia bacterium 4572_132]
MLKITIERKVLLKGLQVVEQAIEDNKIRPVISGIYLEAKNNKIMMKGTDLERTITIVVEGDIEEEGVIVFSHKLIEEYLKEISTQTIKLIEEEGKISIETSDSVSEFSIYNASEYPEIKGLDTGTEFYIDKEIFAKLLEKTKVAASISSDNLAVNCVRVEIEEKILKMIASDTYRMIYCENVLNQEETSEKSIKVSIPLKTVESLLKIIKIVEGDVLNLRYEGSQIFIQIGEISMLSRTIDLAFPDYEKILKNSTYNKKVLANNKELNSILRRVLIFVRNNREAKNSGIFNFVGNKLLIKGVSDKAKVNEKIDTLKEGEDLKISLNVKYLLDFISKVEKENIELHFFNSNSAVLMHGEEEEKFIYLTMPLALREE